MSFVTLINNPVLTCATSNLILTVDQVREISHISSLTQEIEEIRRDEKKKIEESQERGMENGYKEGVERAYVEAKNQFVQYMETAIDKLVDVQSVTKETIVDLAIQITKKIAVDIGTDEMLLGIAKNVLKNYKYGESVKLKVNSNYSEKLEQKLAFVNKENAPHVEVIPDATIGELDCIIVTDSGVTDASFDQQIKSLEMKLKKSLQAQG